MCRVVDTGCCWCVVWLTLVVAGVCVVVDTGCCWCVVWLTLVVAGVSCC